MTVFLVMLGGVGLYAGHPPISAWYIGPIAWVPLLVVARIYADRPHHAFGWGFVGGTIFFGLLLSWLSPFGAIAVAGVVAFEAVFVASVVWTRAFTAETWWGPTLTVLSVVTFETVRSYAPLGGFGWGQLAGSVVDSALLLRSARVLGIHGLNAVLAAVSVTIEIGLWDAWQRRSGCAPDALRRVSIRTSIPWLVAASVIAATVGLGLVVSAGTPEGTVDIALIQGGDTRGTAAAGINQIERTPEDRAETDETATVGNSRDDVNRIVRVAQLVHDATDPDVVKGADLVVWPENSLDTEVAGPRGKVVLGLLYESINAVAPSPIVAGETQSGERPGTRHIAMTTYTENGRGTSYYKRNLVPFGEYVPWRSVLGNVGPLQQISVDAVPGEGPSVMEFNGATVGTVLCFDSVFPRTVYDAVNSGAEVLIVSTNNSSYGRSAMSEQHLAVSQLRAAETGRWVAHAGLSGVSAFVDPDGVVYNQTELFEVAQLRRELPRYQGQTLAVQMGVWPAIVAGTLLLVGLGAAFVQRSKQAL